MLIFLGVEYICPISKLFSSIFYQTIYIYIYIYIYIKGKTKRLFSKHDFFDKKYIFFFFENLSFLNNMFYFFQQLFEKIIVQI